MGVYMWARFTDSSEGTRVHAFPVKASDLVTRRCAACGGLVST